MPKLSELVADEATATISLDLGDLTVTYRPRVLTPAWQQAIVTAERDGDVESSLYRPLAELVASWDLLREDGTPYELTTDGLKDVPVTVLQSVLVGVLVASRPNAERLLGRSTDGSSEQSTPTRTSSRTGTS